MNKIIIPVLASILILGTLGFSQDVFAPPPQKPEKINAGPVKWDGASNFEIKLLIHLHKDSNPADYTVSTTLTLLTLDGTAIGEITTGPVDVPEGVKEGGFNSSVHKLPLTVHFEPGDLSGETIQVIATGDLVKERAKISGYRTVSDVTLKRG